MKYEEWEKRYMQSRDKVEKVALKTLEEMKSNNFTLHEYKRMLAILHDLVDSTARIQNQEGL